MLITVIYYDCALIRMQGYVTLCNTWLYTNFNQKFPVAIDHLDMEKKHNLENQGDLERVCHTSKS